MRRFITYSKVMKLGSSKGFVLASVGMALFMALGCESLRVKLSVRRFAKALGRGDRRAVMSSSTPALNRSLWAKLESSEFEKIVRAVRSYISKGRKAGAGSKSRGKARKRMKVKVGSVRFSKAGARLPISAGVYRLNFFLTRVRGSWKVDDLSIRLGQGSLCLRKDASLFFSLMGFYRAARSGQRSLLIRHSSDDFNRRAWLRLSDSVFRIASRHIRIRMLSGSEKGDGEDEGKGKSRERIRVRFDLAPDLAKIELQKRKQKVVFVMVREKGRWVVDDVLLLYRSLTGRRKLGSLKELISAAGTVRGFIRALSRRKLGRFRSLGPVLDRSRTDGSTREKDGSSFPGISNVALAGVDLAEDRAVLRFEEKAKVDPRPIRRLTAFLVKRSGSWKVSDLLYKGGSSRIRLSQALDLRKAGERLVRASLAGRINRIHQLASRDLRGKVLKHLRTSQDVLELLLSRRINKLLGFEVLPKGGLWARVELLKKLREIKKSLLSGRVKIESAVVSDNHARIRVRFLSRIILVEMVHEHEGWKLDDLVWRAAGSKRSLKEAAAGVIEPVTER